MVGQPEAQGFPVFGGRGRKGAWGTSFQVLAGEHLIVSISTHDGFTHIAAASVCFESLRDQHGIG